MTLYERTYGYHYDRDRSAKDDAKLIRADIKTLAKAGMLPTDWKYSVRFRWATHSAAIDIEATSPRPIMVEDPNKDHRFGHYKENLTDEARSVLEALTDLHAGYNHDGSDTMTDYFDVKFYGVPTIKCAQGVAKWPGGPIAGQWG